jgi:serine phosphatase RsbU (regulator of sigma subunit)
VRAERLGVLDVVLREPPDADALDTLSQLVIVRGYLLPAAHTDIVERARRERSLELPTEMQWSMLPVRAYSCDQFSLAGQLVPAYQVGGDLLDYAVGTDELFVSVIDAMGHGLRASLLGTLAVTALRNARRTGLALADQLRQADRVLYPQFGGEQFVTALAMRIDLATGSAEVVNAGHPPPHLLRDGAITALDVPPNVPLGMFEGSQYVECLAQLLPGDRLVLVSDGLVEATDPVGEEYGEKRLQGALLATAALSTAEAVRHIIRTTRDYQHDELRDDATVLCLDWRGSAGG